MPVSYNLLINYKVINLLHNFGGNISNRGCINTLLNLYIQIDGYGQQTNIGVYKFVKFTNIRLLPVTGSRIITPFNTKYTIKNASCANCHRIIMV